MRLEVKVVGNILKFCCSLHSQPHFHFSTSFKPFVDQPPNYSRFYHLDNLRVSGVQRREHLLSHQNTRKPPSVLSSLGCRRPHKLAPHNITLHSLNTGSGRHRGERRSTAHLTEDRVLGCRRKLSLNLEKERPLRMKFKWLSGTETWGFHRLDDDAGPQLTSPPPPSF